MLIRETGEYKKIKDNWFTPYEEESLTIRDILKNSLYFSPILIIVILLYFWNKTLEKKVRKNTAEVLYLNSLLQQIFLKIPFGCLIFHKDSNKVQLINSKMKDILEIEKDEDVNGKDLYEIFSNVKMYRRCPARNNGDRCPFYMRNVLEIDFNIDHELELITENGKIFNIYLNILPVYQEKSDIKSFMLIFNDFTQKKRLNDILVQNEKMMSLGGLAAGMAHEINNPLSGIAQAAENILRRLSEDNEKNIAVAEELGVNLEDINSYTRKRKIPIFVDDIKKSTLKAAEIIRNMLSFSKNSRSEQDDIFLFSKVVEEAVMLAQKDYDFKRQYDFKTIKIKKELDEELLIKGNRNQIEQVIFNMLKNSAYAIHKKQPEEPEIQLHLKKEKDQAVLKITDNGIGISDDVKKHIFEPFFSTKGVNEGTGLGLSVSFFIIKEKHNGTIEISSNKGEGTTFFIMLPAVDDSNTKE